MGIKFEIKAKAGIIYSVAEGEIGVGDIQANVTRYVADPLFHPELAHLFDGRSATFPFSGKEFRGLINLSKKYRPTAKTALLIDRESKLTYGLTRMFVGWRGETHQVFHDMTSARDWLGLPPEEADQQPITHPSGTVPQMTAD